MTSVSKAPPVGTIGWFDLTVADASTVRDFYQAVVGWDIDFEPGGEMDYRMISASEGLVGGMLALKPEMVEHGARPCWVGYVAVDDVAQCRQAIGRRAA